MGVREGSSVVAGRGVGGVICPRGALECVGGFGMAGRIWKQVSISKEVWADQALLMWDHVAEETW